MALISLDDLEGLDEDEQLDDDITDNPEPMGDEHSDRLLAHWRAVASTHQVTVPTEMRGPIHEMARNNQQREPVPFALVSCQEKMGEVMWEERAYPAGKWACVRQAEELYEQSISKSFMKLMRFICKENSAGGHLGMTIPVVSTVLMTADGKTLDKNVETGFYLPAAFQDAPPQPHDPDVDVVQRDAFTVVARPFVGTTNEETVTRHIGLLRELLGASASERLHSGVYMVAVYENPGVPRRRNEIWFLRR
ncbi:heme-binding protein soul4 [Hippocampus zosterae]|uniref:heme-binding protein soul4 n=1 Tax=Hippocampus zosterae TaxID=109293 RepID=UPI00223D8D79|nr:heme-binding protein soul4 [Hippocampus zosterae]XP_051939938.1 heme-binding protein soul4 [Hippocampus zosterae]XP_051939939.1 heme-binding protein soul4 [Hippocampus zosterae]